jgi:soluble lytic murein transglycosylase-like protein
MPRTASFIAKDRSLRHHNRRHLFSPELNVKLGQEYIRHLMKNAAVSENLVMLAAAYNGGPGNLRKWSRRIKGRDDPLLFLESLPSLETRTFIRRVLGNFWIYRDRLGQKSPSLDALASGAWPAYTSLDGLFDTAQMKPGTTPDHVQN